MPSLLASADRTASPPVLICHEAQSLQQRCGLRLRPTQFPVYAYVLSFTLLLLSKRQHLVRVVDYSLPDRVSHPARGTKLRLAHTTGKKDVTEKLLQRQASLQARALHWLARRFIFSQEFGGIDLAFQFADSSLASRQRCLRYGDN